MSAPENGDPTAPTGGRSDAAFFDLLVRLSLEYDADEGTIGRLKYGTFDPDGARRLLSLLAQVPTEGPVNRELIQLLWMMPPMVGWQAQRREDAGDETARDLRMFADSIVDEGLRIFGPPPVISHD
ncbi:hypothetical protein [Serinibacter arcticus]|uniref:hypothetical protein n=1 Tax=Serinibacter arcticus TaxID=1655435 RepID=UPI00109327D6|nr:hypothetical protein [Serinibacter arcticus]